MKKIICIILLIIFSLLILFSGYNIVMWYVDNNRNTSQIEKIVEKVEIDEINDTPESIIKDKESNTVKEKYVSVDFDELLKINSDVKGWISINGTTVNYPFVQAEDNSYYLNRSIDKTKNSAGWIFADYRNDFKTLSKNTIIYGHNRKDGTMFGSLKEALKDDWLLDKNNYVIKLSTPEFNYVFEVFSVYHIKTTLDYLVTDFEDTDQYEDFLDLITERSLYDFNNKPTTADKVLTLSTCYGSTEKLVMHAKLVKLAIR